VVDVQIDDTIDALTAALVAAGVDPPRPPADPGWLTEIDATLAPLRLPADVRRFWHRVDPWNLQMSAFPSLIRPDFGLRSWKRIRDEHDSSIPFTLFNVGYESWNCMSVELDGPDHVGGALFDWRLDGDAFHRRWSGLGEWLRHITELVAESCVQQVDANGRAYLLLDDYDIDLAVTAPEKIPPHPVYGTQVAFPRDPLKWPSYWQRASGIDPAEAEPRGATASIGDLLTSDSAFDVRATIAGEVGALMGAGDMTRVRVSDGTGQIDIACPGEATAFGPVLGGRYEFDVVVEAGERIQPADPCEAAASTDEPVEQLTRVLLARHGGPVGAVATAVRPLD
jgi:hypothetical protein